VPPPLSDQRLIVGLFPELFGRGGVQEVGRMIAAALTRIAERRNSSASFLSLNDPPGPQSIDYAGQTVSFRGFGRAKLPFVFSSIACARRLAKSARPIILGAHPHLAVPAGLMRRISPRARTIVIAHGIEVWSRLPIYRRSALLRADAVIAPSRDTAQKLVEVQGLAPEKVHRIPWPLSPDFLRLADNAPNLAAPPAFPAKGPVILTVGRWVSSEQYKGADNLIRAIAKLGDRVPNIQLVAVGGGDDLPRLQEIAASVGVTDRIHFLQDLTREEVAACYAHADIFALPSTGEGFGLVFLEAMAFARPIVGAASGGATDLIEDGVNGMLVPPHDVEALAQALNRMLQDDSLRRQMGRCSGEIVRQKYQFAAFQDALEKVCDTDRRA
jgi:phosphatidyl-myo-inositol dimannoside synthase